MFLAVEKSHVSVIRELIINGAKDLFPNKVSMLLNKRLKAIIDCMIFYDYFLKF